MTKDTLKLIDEVRNKVSLLEDELKQKKDEIQLLSKKNSDLEDENKNLKKVSLVAGLTRQLDDRNSRITILESQLENLRKNKKSSKFMVEDSNEESEDEKDNDEIEVEDGYTLITHDDKRLLKNIETRKLYYIGMNGSKGKYAGKESKKGKIKLRD